MLEKPRGKETRGRLRRLLSGLMSRLAGRRSSAQLALQGPTLHFGDFTLELETGHLTRLETAVRIQPQPARVLQYLAERAGGLVTREELRTHLWGEDHHVNFDQGLNFCIQQVRQALDDSARTPTFIETIPRKGYRFLVPVERSGAETGHEPEPWTTRVKASVWLAILATALSGAVALGVLPGSTGPSTRLAVLPFSPAGDRMQERLVAELVGEELSGHLVRALPEGIGVVAALDLAPETARRHTSELGKALRSQLLLEGDVVQHGDRLRVLIRLVRAADGVHLWAGIYEIPTNAEEWPRRFGQVAVEIAGELDSARRARLGGGGDLLGATKTALDGLADRVMMR